MNHRDIRTAQAALPINPARPDPRTLIIAVFIINVLCLSTKSLTAVTLCGFLTILAHAWAGVSRTFWVVAFSIISSAVAFFVGGLFGHTWTGSFINTLGFWSFRFAVVISFAGYFLRSVTPGELTSVLYSLRIPQFLTIPVIVMMRFIPLAYIEFQAVREATALRGIPLGASAWLRHPLRSAEYALVPMLACCSRIADDLAAAGLVRGLGGPQRPTSIIPLRFSLADAVVLIALAAVLAVFFSQVEFIR